MLSHSIDEVSGATLVGGEMRDWSDRSVGGDDRAVAHLVGRLLDRLNAMGGTALFLGPRATALLDAVKLHDVTVTAFTRSLDDVREAAPRHPAVTWVSGSVDRIATGVDGGSFDLVVALGGTHDLLAPDSTGISSHDLVALLAEHVSRDGLLVLDLENRVGLHRFTEFALPTRLSDADFVVGMPGTDDEGVCSRDVVPVAESAGLGVVTQYAAWPDLRFPAVLVNPAGLARHESRAFASHVAQLAARPMPALVDRRASTEEVFAAGLSMELAPGWLLVLGRVQGSGPLLPAYVSAETFVPLELSRVVATDSAGELDATMVAGTSKVAVEGALVTRVAGTPSPGRTLESGVREALARGSRDVARALLGTYATWLFDQSTRPERQDSLFSAVLTNVLWDASDGSMTLLDSSWHVDDPSLTDPYVVLAAALRQLSQGLVQCGAQTPFGPGLSDEEMTTELVVLAGRDLSQVDCNAVRRLSEVLSYVGLTTCSSNGQPTGRATLAAHRDLQEVHVRTLLALDEERAKVRWLEGTLSARNRQVRVLERAIDIESSRAYQAMRQLGRPIPALRRATRRGLNRAQSRWR